MNSQEKLAKDLMLKQTINLIEAAISADRQTYRLYYFIAFRINFSPKEIDQLLDYLSNQIFPYQNPISCLNSVTLLYQISITITNVKILEAMLNNKDLLKHFQFLIIDVWYSAKGLLAMASYLAKKKQWENFLDKAIELIQIWSDLTLMYQGDFPQLHELYKRMRSEGIQFQDKKYDDIRTISRNIPKLNDIPILQMDKSYPGDQKWNLELRNNEVYKGLGALIVLQEYLDKHPTYLKKVESKIKFLFQYIMNLRSRFSNELRKIELQTFDIDERLEELKQNMNELSLGLKDAKFHLDKAGIVIKSTADPNRHYRYEEDDKDEEVTVPSVGVHVIELGKIDTVHNAQHLNQYLLDEEQEKVDERKIKEILKQLKSVDLKI